jgi:hypothetical protein
VESESEPRAQPKAKAKSPTHHRRSRRANKPSHSIVEVPVNTQSIVDDRQSSAVTGQVEYPVSSNTEWCVDRGFCNTLLGEPSVTEQMAVRDPRRGMIYPERRCT